MAFCFRSNLFCNKHKFYGNSITVNLFNGNFGEEIKTCLIRLKGGMDKRSCGRDKLDDDSIIAQIKSIVGTQKYWNEHSYIYIFKLHRKNGKDGKDFGGWK